MNHNLKGKLFFILIWVFSIIPLFAHDVPGIMFESESVREYSYVILPFREYYMFGSNIKTISITSYENDIVENKVNKYFPNEYIFDENGQMKFISIISDSVAENRTEYFYNGDGFLKEILQQQYTYNQLYKEKKIVVLRLQDNDEEVRIIEKELHADEIISTETIINKGSRFIYKSDSGGTDIVRAFIFNDKCLIEKIEINKSFPDLPHLPGFYKEILISYDEQARIIEYRELKDGKETKYYYTFEYDANSKLIRIVETDFAQNGQYKRVYNFISYDEYGNWLRYRKDIYSWGEKISEYYLDRELEYW